MSPKGGDPRSSHQLRSNACKRARRCLIVFSLRPSALAKEPRPRQPAWMQRSSSQSAVDNLIPSACSRAAQSLTCSARHSTSSSSRPRTRRRARRCASTNRRRTTTAHHEAGSTITLPAWSAIRRASTASWMASSTRSADRHAAKPCSSTARSSHHASGRRRATSPEHNSRATLSWRVTCSFSMEECPTSPHGIASRGEGGPDKTGRHAPIPPIDVRAPSPESAEHRRFASRGAADAAGTRSS